MEHLEIDQGIFFNNDKRQNSQYHQDYIKKIQSLSLLEIGMEIDYFFNHILAFIEKEPNINNVFNKIDISLMEDSNMVELVPQEKKEKSKLREEDYLDSQGEMINEEWFDEFNYDICHMLGDQGLSFLKEKTFDSHHDSIIPVPLQKSIRQIEIHLENYLPDNYKKQKEQAFLKAHTQSNSQTNSEPLKAKKKPHL